MSHQLERRVAKAQPSRLPVAVARLHPPQQRGLIIPKALRHGREHARPLRVLNHKAAPHVLAHALQRADPLHGRLRLERGLREHDAPRQQRGECVGRGCSQHALLGHVVHLARGNVKRMDRVQRVFSFDGDDLDHGACRLSVLVNAANCGRHARVRRVFVNGHVPSQRVPGVLQVGCGARVRRGPHVHVRRLPRFVQHRLHHGAARNDDVDRGRNAQRLERAAHSRSRSSIHC